MRREFQNNIFNISKLIFQNCIKSHLESMAPVQIIVLHQPTPFKVDPAVKKVIKSLSVLFIFCIKIETNPCPFQYE